MKDLHELQVGNRTYRRFLQDPVPRAVLEYALENARVANSAMNRQPLKYIAVASEEKVAQMKPLVVYAAALPPEIGTPHDDEQPTAFIVITDDGKKGMTDVDLGIAIHSITLSLYEKGFGSCVMANIRVQEIAKLLNVPEDRNVRIVIAIGKPGCTSTVVEAGDSLKYYVDDGRNYYVPKRAFGDIAEFQ